MPTLSEITLQHSRDLSALDVDCRARQDAIERDRAKALQGLTAARPALLQYESARSEAATIRDNAVAHAASAFEDAQAKGTNARFDELDKVQQRYISADRAADDARLAARKKEDADYKATLERIDHSLSLEQQFAAREAATKEHNEALAAIDGARRTAREANRDKQQLEFHAALDKERLGGEQAADARDAAIGAAGITFQAANKLALTRLKNALASLPEAAAIGARFDKRQKTVQQNCQAEVEALFAKFHEALKTATG